ncbi:hypothetical protein [Pseudohoeflea coraliihabitans]|uniref:Uncharacterized protein n=1 Tax=Pseudohoeflea coraliihabitans TaxID=2860393 RepID=A0ABS6WSR6_9HYPH|nr:hypothetical protein [Pseudohoeflea sp. DP4N28-3]MBW3098980.1 hypothetical protein [Pseudohoeflea sp. DP4N28-3]
MAGWRRQLLPTLAVMLHFSAAVMLAVAGGTYAHGAATPHEHIAADSVSALPAAGSAFTADVVVSASDAHDHAMSGSPADDAESASLHCGAPILLPPAEQTLGAHTGQQLWRGSNDRLLPHYTAHDPPPPRPLS